MTWPLGMGRSAPRVQIEALGRRGRLEPVGEAHLAGERHRLGPPGEHRLGTEVDPHSGDLAGQQLAAEPVRGLEHGHARSAVQQPVGGGQTGDTAPDDDDMTRARTCVCVHVSTVPDPTDGPVGPGTRERAGEGVHDESRP